jgi:hypothetical protein
MKVADEDLRALRALLQSRKSTARATAAKEMSTRQLVLVAAMVLQAVGKTTFSRGEYGGLLHELLLRPGMPARGWRKKPEPDWYRSNERLVTASRRLGIHTGVDRAGRNLVLQPQPVLVALIGEDPAYLEKVRAWFEAAYAVVLRQLEMNAAGRRHKTCCRRAISRHPALRDFLPARMYTPYYTLVKLRNELNAVLDECGPPPA